MLTFIISAIRLGMAFLFGATGEIITEKSGHLNLGIPGIMCVGAASGCLAESIYYKAANGNANMALAIIIPIIFSMLGAALMGLIYCFITVTLRTNQNVTGLALTTLGIGLSKFIIKGANTASMSAASTFFRTPIPFLKNVFPFGVLVYIALTVAIVTSFVLNRTRVGLHLRAVGENPATADAAGINVTAYRYIATCIGSGIAGIGGLCFIMDYLTGCWEYMVDVIGWLAIALVIFTIWKPIAAIFGSVIFGALYILSSYITGVGIYIQELFKMVPYVVTILVLIIISARKKRENQPPQALGLAYFREDR